MVSESTPPPMPYRHQWQAVQALLANRRFGLWDEQGLGKTPVALMAALCCAVRSDDESTSVLIIAPSAVLWNWARECRVWLGLTPTVIDSTARLAQVADELKAQHVGPIVVLTHGLLLSPQVAAWVTQKRWGVVIVDEAHEFRSPMAIRSRTLYTGHPERNRRRLPTVSVVSRADRVWLLTGTPMPNHPGELYSFLRGLFPERLAARGIRSHDQFCRRYCRMRQTPWGNKIVGIRNNAELREMLSGTHLRRTKDQVLSLPATSWQHVTVGGSEQTALHDFELSHQIAPTDLLDRGETAYAEWRRLAGEAKVPAAAHLLLGTPGPVVAFCYHLSVLDGLEAVLRPHRPVLRLDGSVPARRRTELVERFQSGTEPDPIFLAQIQAGGVGITLTRSAELVIVEPSFVPGQNAQAVDRVRRIGQTKPVRVRFLSMARSAGDEHVVEALRLKSQMIHKTLSNT